MKNMLTFAFQKGYSESLKTANTASAPRQRVFFISVFYGRMRAENNQYQPKHLLAAFSESAHCSVSVGILRKANKMNALVKILNNQVITDTTMIAVVFGKKHCDVMRAVQQLDLPEDFGKRNFALSSYHAGTRDYPMYEITRDGFTLLAMGFTGKKAMEWKIKYINAFNTMEKALREQNPAPAITTDREAMKAIGGMVKKCCGVAVREALAEMLLSADDFEAENWQRLIAKTLALRTETLVAAKMEAKKQKLLSVIEN